MAMIDACPDFSVVLLVGGLGTRLRSVVKDVPKSLARVNGRPFIYYLFDQIQAANVRKVILCTGHLGDHFEQALLNKEHHGIEIVLSREYQQLGTAGALKHAVPLISDRNVLVMNGDSYATVDLLAFEQFHITRRANVSMAIAEVENSSRYETVILDNKYRVKEIVQRQVQSGKCLINAGLYFFDKSVFSKVPEDLPCSLEKEILPLMIGNRFYGYPNCEPFIDIGTPQSYQLSQEYFGSEKV